MARLLRRSTRECMKTDGSRAEVDPSAVGRNRRCKVVYIPRDGLTTPISQAVLSKADCENRPRALQRCTVPELRRGGGDLLDGQVQRSSRTITGGGRARAGHPTAENSSQLRSDLKHNGVTLVLTDLSADPHSAITSPSRRHRSQARLLHPIFTSKSRHTNKDIYLFPILFVWMPANLWRVNAAFVVLHW
jgi:hypothetical protein